MWLGLKYGTNTFFVALSLENGMDIKTLSIMLGYVLATTTPDIYTCEECGKERVELITQMKREIAAVKVQQQFVPDGISNKKRAVMDYMKTHPEVKNKSQITEGAGVNRLTVHRYYDSIRKEI